MITMAFEPRGGFGAAPPATTTPQPKLAEAPRARPPWFRYGVAVIILGIAGLLVARAARPYLRGSKPSEAMEGVGEIAKRAAQAFERDGQLCPTASSPVPATLAAVSGRAYRSRPEEWLVDAPQRAGFACLQFSLAKEQRYQYAYTATQEAFEVTARGDVDGNGRTSLFVLRGAVRRDSEHGQSRLEISANVEMTDPEE